MKWILPIHDAGIVTWSGANRMRYHAVREMNDILDDREDIMYNFLNSIGLTPKGFVKYAKLMKKVEQMNKGEIIYISPYLLK